MRTCHDCPADLTGEYHRRQRCRPCAKIHCAKRVRENHRRWIARNPTAPRIANDRHLYGIEPEVRAFMFKRQGGLCALCREGPASHLDHDHTDGHVRGLLCDTCNRGIGYLKDSPAILLAGAAYLALPKPELV